MELRRTGLRYRINRGLLGGPRLYVYKGDPGELKKNWITAEEKKQFIYELSEVATVLLAYDAAE